jgi:uncharacterized protein
MKFLLLLLVVVGGLAWLAWGRKRPPADVADDAKARRDAAPPPATPQSMLACAHCGVHLPAADALRDAGGRAYCSEAHRLAGPRSSG